MEQILILSGCRGILGVYVVNMFDTGQASRVLNYSRNSLAFMMMHQCSVTADKQYQLADWRMR